MASKVGKRGPCPRCKTRPRSKSSTYCKKCGAKKAREEYATHPERCRKRGKDWRKKNRAKALKAQEDYRKSEKGKKKRREYRNSLKGQAVYNAWRLSPEGQKAHRAAEKKYRKKMRGLTANLPVEVVRPFMLRMLKDTDAEYVSGGKTSAKSNEGASSKLAELVGIPKHRIWDIAYRKRLRSVSIEDADRLAMYGDFSLAELYERAEEWALLTGSKWPEGYAKKKSRRKVRKRRSREEVRELVFQLLREEPLDQAQLAKKLHFYTTGGVSKIMVPLELEGKVVAFREQGHLKKKYRLVS